MRTTTKIPFEILNTATALLSPYVLDLSPEMLLKALETYNEEKEELPANQSLCPEKPFKREEAAEMLGLSISTIDRYLAQGKLKRIRYSSHEVRVTPKSVYKLMEGGAA